MTLTSPRPASTTSVVGRALVSLMVAVLVLLGAGLHGAPPALADEPAPAVTVALTSVSPASPSVTDTVTITGQVRNTSGRPLTKVQVYLWRSTDALADRPALSDVLSSQPDNPLGRRVLVPGSFFNVTDVSDARSQAVPSGKATLEPGESVTFSVRAAVQGEAGLGLSSGVYLSGVQVRGAIAGSELETLGRARTLLTVTGPGAAPAPTHPVVMLDSRPSLLGRSVFLDDHLTDDLDGRLASLLALAQQEGTTLLVDPALFDALTVMSKGYTVRTTPALSAAALAHGQQAAKTFLAALEPLLNQGRAYRTLYGNPDVARSVAADRAELVTDAAVLPKGHRLARLPLAVVPARLHLDRPSAEVLAPLRPAMVLASNLAASATVQSTAGIPVVRVRDDAFDGGPGPNPATSTPQVIGRLQAEQRLGREVTTLVTSAQQADAELAAAPWRRRVALTGALAAARPADATLDIFEVPALDERAADALDAAGESLVTWGELVGDRLQAQELAGSLLPQTVSTTWGGDTAAATAWLTAAQEQRDAALAAGGVRLHVVRHFVTSADDQEIPVTVTNGLREPVTVKVHFESENPQRMSVADTAAITVAPGDSDTVKVRVTTSANGEVGVTARLVTTSGREVSPVEQVTITATQAGRVGWIIIIASGVVLMAGTAIRIRQVQKERRLPPGPAQAAHWTTTTRDDSE